MVGATSELTIRRAFEADAEQLCTFGANAFVAAFGHLYPESHLSAFLADSYTSSKWATFLRDPATESWVSVDDAGEFAGYAQAGPCDLPVEDMPAGAIELKRLYVDPTCVSRGIGAGLMQRVMDWGAEKGNPPFYIGVWSENDGAQRFYARYGFHRVGEYKFAVGETLDHEFILRRSA